MSERDLIKEFKEWLADIERKHHRRSVSVLFGFPQSQGVTMAEQVLDVSPPVVTVDAALGTVRDADGNAVADPVASGTWTVDDSVVGTIAAATDGTLGAVVTLSEVAGTLNVTFTGTTVSGASVTGAGQIVVTVPPPPPPPPSGATSVDVVLTAVSPPSAA